MKFEDAGSPILAKQNPSLYWFVVLTIAVVVFLLLVFFIVRKITNYIHSPKFIEAHKKTFTTKKHIKVMVKKASLSNEEAKLLWLICKKNSASNILYLNNDSQAMERMFSQEYSFMKSKGTSQEQINQLFTLITKMERLRNQNVFITTSVDLKPGQELIFHDREGFNWTLYLQKNTPQGIFLELPKLLSNGDLKPEPLSKFVLTVTGKNNIAYSMSTRVIRYEEALDGTSILVIKQSNSLEPIQRRNHKRMTVDAPCIFSEVEPRSTHNESSKSYAVLGNSFNGKIENISAAGCRMIGNTNIMAGRYLQIKFQLGSEEMEAVGVILSTTKNSSLTATSYHIKFTDIQLALKNKINAFAYGFDAI